MLSFIVAYTSEQAKSLKSCFNNSTSLLDRTLVETSRSKLPLVNMKINFKFQNFWESEKTFYQKDRPIGFYWQIRIYLEPNQIGY